MLQKSDGNCLPSECKTRYYGKIKLLFLICLQSSERGLVNHGKGINMGREDVCVNMLSTELICAGLELTILALYSRRRRAEKAETK